MMKNIMICGITGWCMEILFTGFQAFRKRQLQLVGQTSLWMFPIYGLAAFIQPIYKLIKKRPALLRGTIYALLIFTCEYLSGSLLKKKNICPWDYSTAKLHLNGIIRFDYGVFWIFAGLIFEKILGCRQS